MIIITASEFRQLPGTYDINSKKEGGKSQFHTSANGAEAAAAKCMEIAIQEENYIIFGDKKVLDCIPENLRKKLT